MESWSTDFCLPFSFDAAVFFFHSSFNDACCGGGGGIPAGIWMNFLKYSHQVIRDIIRLWFKLTGE